MLERSCEEQRCMELERDTKGSGLAQQSPPGQAQLWTSRRLQNDPNPGLLSAVSWGVAPEFMTHKDFEQYLMIFVIIGHYILGCFTAQ